MGVFYRYLLVFGLFLLPLGLFANVGHKDGDLGRAAACDNNPEAIGTKAAATKEVNPENVLALLGEGVADAKKRKFQTNPEGSSDISK